MTTDITFLSLTAVPSDRNCPDGSLDISLSLINEDGELKPIAAPRAVESAPALPDSRAEVVLVHKIQHGTDMHSHLVIYDRTNSRWLWAEADGSDAEYHTIGVSASAVPYGSAVTAIGRMLCFVSPTTTVYALWKTDCYNVFSTDLFAYQLQLTRGERPTMATVRQTFSKDTFNSFFFSTDYTHITATGARAVYNALDAERNKQIEQYGDTYFKGKVLGVAAVRLYDGSYTNISMPFLIDNTVSPTVYYYTNNSSVAPDYTFSATGGTMNTASITLHMDISGMEDIVSGVDIFLTREVDFLTPDTALYTSPLPGTSTHDNGTVTLPYLTQDKVYDAIDRLLFYRSATIEPSQFDTAVELHRVAGTETTLSLADMRNYTIGGAAAVTYNSRLHIAAANTTLNGSTLATTLEPFTRPSSGDTWVWGSYRQAVLKATVDGGRTIAMQTVVPFPLPHILAFPIGNLTNVTLLMNTGEASISRKYLAIPLTLHSSSTASLSYFTRFADGRLYAPEILDSYYITSEAEWAEANVGARQSVTIASSPSLVKVSEVENPLVFPAKNSVQVGSATIKALAANTQPISEGQFGSAPLYAFTDEGVWVLMVGAEGSYESRQPVSRNICSNVKGILQTDDAVLFPTAKGIVMQQGRSSTCITDTIDTAAPFSFAQFCGVDTEAQLCAHSGIDTATIAAVSFRTFLSGADMIYSYADARVILFNPSYAYAYVYSLRSGTWATMPSSLRSRINSYPEAYAVATDGSIVDLAQPTTAATTAAPYLLCTRPLALSSPDVFKAVQAAAVRGFFHGEKACATALFASNDLCHWFPVASSLDHRLRPISGSPYKFFRLVCTGSLATGQTITSLTVQFAERRKNKLR